MRTMLHMQSSDIINKISKSNNIEQRRIDKLTEDIEDSLYVKTSQFFIYIDESTLPRNS